MPAPTLQKVLIIGSGPVRIGQTGAFDAAACRACDILKRAGVQTVMVHCDPSALAADLDMADRTYMVPLTVASVTEILLRENPDALLPTVGGPAALALAKTIADSGLLEKNGIQLLGTSPEIMSLMADASSLARIALKLGVAVTDGKSISSMAEAAEAAEALGYPVFVRACNPADPLRQGIAYNVEELRSLVSGGRLPKEKIDPLRIEQALSGYTEVEVELLREADGEIRMVAMAENMDPAGIHSGDSLAAIPPVTIETKTCQEIEAVARQLAQGIEVTGSLHLKFAVTPDGNRIVVLSIDPWFSRMSAFCAKAYGIDLAAVHAHLCLGAGLEETLEKENTDLTNITGGKIVAVRLPRWEFERFAGEDARLDARMKSTGAVMGLGRSLAEAIQAAIISRSPRSPLPGLGSEMGSLSLDDLMQRLVLPTPERLGCFYEALKKGARPEDLSTAAGIDVQWMHALASLAELEKELGSLKDGSLPNELVTKAVEAGFFESGLARLLEISEKDAGKRIEDAGVRVRPYAVGERENARVWFPAAATNNSHHSPLGKSVLVVGPGSGRIGHGIEQDHCCVHAARALRAAGRRAVLINANPAATGGVNDFDRTYIAPLTSASVKTVCQSEKPDGIILQFGGYAAMDLAGELETAGYRVLGTSPRRALLSQDRLQFSAQLTDMGIPHPHIGMAESPEQAMDLAEAIGYPLIASVPADRKRNRYAVIMDAHMLERDLLQTRISADSPMLLEQFLEYAIEVEADALCDGKSVYVPTVMEHIELAGVHSGDVSMVVPPYSTPPRHVETIGAYIRKIALELKIEGLLNARFAVYNDTVYLLAVRPWACRTLPMISKICDVPMAQRAVEIMLGMGLDEMDLPRRILPHYGIRASVFPFDTFSQADPLLTPQMRSTGQTMALDPVFGMAYYASKEAAGPCLPQSGNLLITVTDADKPSILEPARLFTEMGFGILATRGTHAFLVKNGIQAQLVKKLGFGRPDLVDAIKTGDVAVVVNTPSGSRSQQDDALIRKTAIRYNIPNITTPAGALAAAKGIAARKQGQDALCTLQSYARTIR